MTLEIVTSSSYSLVAGGTVYRHADVVITNNGNNYLWGVPGLPTEGDLYTILAPMEADLLAAAIAAGAQSNALEAEEPVALAGARGWFRANPNAKLLFTLSIPDLQTEIYSLVDTSFPSMTAGNRNRWKLLLMAIAVTIRILVKKQKLN